MSIMNKRIWLFGAGKIGKQYVDECGTECCVGFVDNDQKKSGEMVKGLRVHKYSEFKDKFNQKEEVICITCANTDDIYLQLSEDGFAECVRAYLPGKGIISIEDLWGQCIHSQLGEEVGLMHYFGGKGFLDGGYKGFYLDIGAYHPFRGNNTWWAYKKGWRGINIDANEESMRLFRAVRPDDINICCGVSDRDEELEYYMFHGAAGMNTFLSERKDVREVENVKLIKMRNINDILEEYNVEKIDFVDIDVEGIEEKIVNTFNWKKYSPKCVLIELLGQMSIEDILQTPIHKKMKAEGYFLKSYYTVTALYIRK